MDINEAIGGRRSVRDYTSLSVDKKVIRELINAAILAPSAVNQQPWTFTVVRDQSVLDRVSREAKSHMLATMPQNAQSEHFWSHLTDPSFHIFYHARADPDLGRRAGALDCRRLRARGRKSHAGRVRCRTRQLLDRFCAELSQHARRKGSAGPAVRPGARCTNHHWPSKGCAPSRSA
jgi:nitroreductase